MMDGSDDAVDCRRPCHIYRERQSSECTGLVQMQGYPSRAGVVQYSSLNKGLVGV